MKVERVCRRKYIFECRNEEPGCFTLGKWILSERTSEYSAGVGGKGSDS